MLTMNLNKIQGTSTTMPQLKPWEIHDVTFKGFTYNEFKGKKDPDMLYQTMRVRWENEKGYHEETVFCPKDGDEVRRTSEVTDPATGGKITKEQISNYENFQLFIAHVGEQLFPTKYEKLKGQPFSFPKDFPMFVNTLIEASKAAVGKATKLKLIADSKGGARLPYFGGLDKDGNPRVVNNFLGEKVFFSKYEMDRMANQQNTKPTAMPASNMDDLGSTDAGAPSDLDWDI